MSYQEFVKLKSGDKVRFIDSPSFVLKKEEIYTVKDKGNVTFSINEHKGVFYYKRFNLVLKKKNIG